MSGGLTPRIAVLDYGIGNLHSAHKALERVGADARLTADRAEIAAADAVVLPGVGAFGACMEAVRRTGLDEVAREVAASGTPFLGICVGMQLLYERSAESPGVAGLGILPGEVGWLPEGVKRPQIQWNQIEVHREHPLVAGLDGAWLYFVHSLAPVPSETGDEVVAVTDYGGDVVSVVADGSVMATQFHPEKSARAGFRLLSNFVGMA
ncbi:MAG: imidazole glycerol phosphate synthase subunit HisH [Acidimicrobiales bacterium]